MAKNKAPKIVVPPMCNDHPSKFAHLGVRWVFAWLGLGALGLGITEGRYFFVSAGLYVAPIFFDYFKFTPDGICRNVINNIAKLVDGLLLSVASAGILGVLTVKSSDNELFVYTVENYILSNYKLFSVQDYYYALMIVPSICIVDWLVNISFLEREIIKNEMQDKGGR